MSKPSSTGQVRILHIASGDLFAGAEAMLLDLCRGQSRHPGVTVDAALLNDGLLARHLREAGCRVHILDERRMNFMQILGAISRLIKEAKPQIVHTHRTKENVLGGIAASIQGVPSLRTVHGAPEHQDADGSMRARVIMAADSLSARRLQRASVAVSKDLSSRTEGAVDRAGLRVIYNGLDVADVQRRAMGESIMRQHAKGHRITFLGRLVPVKRVELLIEALVVLEARSPDSHELCIVGDGPEVSTLMQQAHESGVSGRITFTGFVENAMPILKQSDCLALASAHEGLPMCLLEAIALGIPIAAPAVGGIPEVVTGKRGVLFEDASPDMIAEAIESAIGIGVTADPDFPESFTRDAMADSYLALYGKLIGAPILEACT